MILKSPSKNKLLSNLIVLSIALLICLLIGEFILRGFIEVTEDNNRSLYSFQILPFQIPIRATQEKVFKYEQNKSKSRLLYDSISGWSPNPNFVSDDSMYIYNNTGIRVEKTNDEIPEPGENDFQIILLGDSFTHGDEVFFNETWGAQLKYSLSGSNTICKVYNLGVSGYGLDQALLRLKSIKNRFTPKLLIVGISFENIIRNVNILRPIYSPLTRIPFSKPRFIFSGGKLENINSPCLSPDRVIKILTHLNDWKLLKHEHLYNSNYSSSFIYESYLYSTLETVFSYFSEISDIYKTDNEAVSVTKEILSEIKNEADSLKVDLLFVDLPNRNDLLLASWLGYLPYREVLDMYRSKFDFITTVEKFINEDNTIDDYFLHTHYSKLGNKAIAESVHEYLENKTTLE